MKTTIWKPTSIGTATAYFRLVIMGVVSVGTDALAQSGPGNLVE